MYDTTPAALRAVRWSSVTSRQENRRCPNCGSGDLFEIRLRRPAGGERRAAYCAGLYDRQRRRIVSRSCGYSEGDAAASESA
jgi:hypothetical protein